MLVQCIFGIVFLSDIQEKYQKFKRNQCLPEYPEKRTELVLVKYQNEDGI